MDVKIRRKVAGKHRYKNSFLPNKMSREMKPSSPANELYFVRSTEPQMRLLDLETTKWAVATAHVDFLKYIK